MASSECEEEELAESGRGSGSEEQPKQAGRSDTACARPMWIDSRLVDSEAMLSAYLEFAIKCCAKKKPRPPQLAIYNHKGEGRPPLEIGTWEMLVVKCSQADCERRRER